jgi:hypothetical protein
MLARAVNLTAVFSVLWTRGFMDSPVILSKKM